MKVIDGNEAAARVAYQASEIIAIYPITPASAMGELADEWSARGDANLWGQAPKVIEMQSEAGAAGVLHGALQGGSLATTFTSSQGLLLMIPDMYKIAGELSCTVFHVAARSLAAHALSIFGDHSDVMAARGTGFAMLFSGSVQEAMDLALVAHASTLRAHIPFMHVFDGFRTSHELCTVDPVTPEHMRALLSDQDIAVHRQRALSPDHPVMRGSAQNPDVFFQAREACSPYYAATPGIVEQTLREFGDLTGRHYGLFEYCGHPQAERVVVVMGSGSRALQAVVRESDEPIGVVQVRLYRPFSIAHLLKVMPTSARRVAVLDRCKEPGAPGEPLFLDVVAALASRRVHVFGGRYGLSSKEFTPAMARAVFHELAQDEPRTGFTVGILDDVSGSSLEIPDDQGPEPGRVQAVLWGLGSDGTVGSSKNTVKIVGEEAGMHVQGYSVYDSKKSGARTISHLRFGNRPLEAPWLVQRAGFIGIHQFDFVRRYPVLDLAEPGAIVLLNSPFPAESVWGHLPRGFQQQLLDRGLKLWVVDAHQIAAEAGLGGRINTVMQTCFFELSQVLPRDEARRHIEESIDRSYPGPLAQMNRLAVGKSLDGLAPVSLEGRVADGYQPLQTLPDELPAYLRGILQGHGDQVPVSAMPPDGTFPTGTARLEKRSLATEVPVWAPEHCIECGKCVLICPHSAIRAKLVEPADLAEAPAGLRDLEARWKELKGHDDRYVLAVAEEDCTGCTLCVEVCPTPVKSLHMESQRSRREEGRKIWSFFESLPERLPEDLSMAHVKNLQLRQPLFEFSGACQGCGETPYLKILSQLFGDRALIANATGCSSIYGGNLPTTPWCHNSEGRGPAWSNSLFEDNAEFGLGMRLAVDQQTELARARLSQRAEALGPELVAATLAWKLEGAASLREQRARIALLQARLEELGGPALDRLVEHLVPRSVWLVGGDGWAYDIGFGGLDHVLATGANVKVLVLDTEVYSNTGGQASKSTPLGAIARFAAGGKRTGKKDMISWAMSYGHVYVAQVCLGASDKQTVQAFLEAENHVGPAFILAYSPCIAHGFEMAQVLEHQRLAVATGYWPLLRYHPERGLTLDSKAPQRPLADFFHAESRFADLLSNQPEVAAELLEEAQAGVDRRWQRLVGLST